MTDTTRSELSLRDDSSDAGHICPRSLDRRSFLRDASIAVGAALIAGGLIPGQAFADGITSITALPAGAAGSAGMVERAYALPTADGVSVDIDSRVALVRVNRQIFAFSLECPHKGRLLEWNDSERRFYCSKHKARFSADGQHASGRRTPNLDRFALKVQGNRVIVAVDRVLAADSTPAEWAGAMVRV
jgi:nitrite reductase/ring-hydroxylating ferredoxin subunit